MSIPGRCDCERRSAARCHRRRDAFQDAFAALNELGVAGFELYIADGMMHLMRGNSHDEHGMKQQDKIADSVFISSCCGGAWYYIWPS